MTMALTVTATATLVESMSFNNHTLTGGGFSGANLYAGLEVGNNSGDSWTGVDQFSFQTVAVPEPSFGMLLLLGFTHPIHTRNPEGLHALRVSYVDARLRKFFLPGGPPP